MPFTDKQREALKKELDRMYILLNRADEAGYSLSVKYLKGEINRLEEQYISLERTNSL